MRRLSVIVTNFNYVRFVGSAVDSALELDWPDVEVIVVDDGSTDGSVELLETYGTQIRLYTQTNAGQRSAANFGFSESTGDVIVFLDADDLLPPEFGRRIAIAVRPGVSKIQVQAQRVDEFGTPYGAPFPEFRRIPDGATVRKWMARTSAYPTPPGSANAYMRWFLERLMPIPDTGDSAADSALLAAAPLLGDVVTLTGVAVSYRRHEHNDSALLSDVTHFAREVRRARNRWRTAAAAAGAELDEQVLRRSRELLQLRAVACRLTPAEESLPHERRRRILWDALRAPFHPGPESIVRRVIVSVWTVVVLSAPTPIVLRAVRRRWAGRA